LTLFFAYGLIKMLVGRVPPSLGQQALLIQNRNIFKIS